MTDLSTAIDKAINHYKDEIGGLQVGRATTNLVDEVMVESYGAQMSLKGVASITCPDSSTIRIEPWDKTNMAEIEKGILESNVGITPQNMGDYILLPIPPMTEERRKDIVKVLHKMTEDAKITLRNVRHDEMKDIKKLKDDKDISEDEAKKQEKETQETIDTANKEIDQLATDKEKDIMKV